jgi:hypothetical protein
VSTRIEAVGAADAVRARVPEVLRAWQDARAAILEEGSVETELKRLCARYFLGDPEVAEIDDRERFDERQRAALAWAEAIAWDPTLADDDLWRRLHAHFSEPELVELGYCMALMRGQIQWLRVLGIEPGPAASAML